MCEHFDNCQLIFGGRGGKGNWECVNCFRGISFPCGMEWFCELGVNVECRIFIVMKSYYVLCGHQEVISSSTDSFDVLGRRKRIQKR